MDNSRGFWSVSRDGIWFFVVMVVVGRGGFVVKIVFGDRFGV